MAKLPPMDGGKPKRNFVQRKAGGYVASEGIAGRKIPTGGTQNRSTAMNAGSKPMTGKGKVKGSK
jgi:hypothetical protein